jgi:hypothetical protein
VHHRQSFLRGKLAAHAHQVLIGVDADVVAGEAVDLCTGTSLAFFGHRGAAGQEANAAVGHDRVGAGPTGTRQQRDVLRAEAEVSCGIHIGCRGTECVASHQRGVACALNRGAKLLAAVGQEVVVRIARAEVVAAPAVDGGERQVVASHHLDITSAADLRGRQVDVVARAGQQHAGAADVHGGHAVYAALAEAVVARIAFAALGGAGDVDVTPCHRREAGDGGYRATYVVDVFAGVQGHVLCAYLAAQVVDAVGIELHGLAAHDAAAVGQIASGVNGHVVATEQCAAGRQVAFADGGVDVGHQGLADAAIGQGDVFLLEPDDVVGENYTLRREERFDRVAQKFIQQTQVF